MYESLLSNDNWSKWSVLSNRDNCSKSVFFFFFLSKNAHHSWLNLLAQKILARSHASMLRNKNNSLRHTTPRKDKQLTITSVLRMLYSWKLGISDNHPYFIQILCVNHLHVESPSSSFRISSNCSEMV